jgi:hypothetical protein
MLDWLAPCPVAKETESHYFLSSILQQDDTCYFFCLCGNVALLLILLFNLIQTMQMNFLPEASILQVPGVPSRDCRSGKALNRLPFGFGG